MIVDDDPATLQSLRQILGEEDHPVDEAPNGQVALRHFAGNPADLVICDVYMRVVQGTTTLHRMRGRPPHRYESHPRTGRVEWRSLLR
jgi:CheY-like chemotaxis protein